MKFEYRFALSMIIGGGLVVFGISQMPALTTGGNAESTGVSQEEFEAAVLQEMDFCRDQPENIDCQCFAQKSGVILTQNKARVPGAFYADQRELARGQAARSC